MSGYREGAREVLKESYWTVWKAGPLIILLIALAFGLKSLGLIGSKIVERQVLVNSNQYIEGMEQRAGVLKANIVEAEEMARMYPDRAAEFESQKRVLSAQLRAIEK